MGLPILGVESIYFFIEKINPLSSSLFVNSLFLIVPFLFVKADELRNKLHDDTLVEFRAMTRLELAECEQEVMSLPPSRNSALFKEAYREVYKEKFGIENRG